MSTATRAQSLRPSSSRRRQLQPPVRTPLLPRPREPEREDVQAREPAARVRLGAVREQPADEARRLVREREHALARARAWRRAAAFAPRSSAYQSMARRRVRRAPHSTSLRPRRACARTCRLACVLTEASAARPPASTKASAHRARAAGRRAEMAHVQQRQVCDRELLLRVVAREAADRAHVARRVLGPRREQRRAHVVLVGRLRPQARRRLDRRRVPLPLHRGAKLVGRAVDARLAVLGHEPANAIEQSVELHDAARGDKRSVGFAAAGLRSSLSALRLRVQACSGRRPVRPGLVGCGELELEAATTRTQGEPMSIMKPPPLPGPPPADALAGASLASLTHSAYERAAARRAAARGRAPRRSARALLVDEDVARERERMHTKERARMATQLSRATHEAEHLRTQLAESQAQLADAERKLHARDENRERRAKLEAAAARRDAVTLTSEIAWLTAAVTAAEAERDEQPASSRPPRARTPRSARCWPTRAARARRRRERRGRARPSATARSSV